MTILMDILTHRREVAKVFTLDALPDETLSIYQGLEPAQNYSIVVCPCGWIEVIILAMSKKRQL